MDELTALRNRINRERSARKQAEVILEHKALELFEANKELIELNDDLEQRVAEQARALIDSEQKYKRIIENMELGLLEVDRNGRIIKAYDWFCDMVGYSPEELEGGIADEILLPEEYRSVLKEQDKNRLRGQAAVYEIQLRKKNNDLIWVLISGAPIFDKTGRVVGSFGIHYDITKQKNLQQELEEAKQVAEAAQEAEKQFLANMSHEIRTPLNAVIGMTHLLFDTPLSSKQKEYLSILKSSAALLRGLISDILDFSKIESGQLEVQMKEFDLIGLLKSAQKTFQLKLENRPVEMELDVDSRIVNMVLGDDLMLNQILFNLIGNAEKFTSDGSIKLIAKLLEKKQNTLHVEFQVVDTGIGIEPEKKELIFMDFKQANNDIKLKYGGTGLGLAITKRLIEMQGGSISVESEVGKGTSFIFDLTYEDTGRKALANSKELTQSVANSIEKLKVLVAEDNYMNRKYISTLLNKWGVDFILVMNGQEAVEIAHKEIFDLILMDIQMPIMDGVEATIGIRNTTNFNTNIPIIALTASALLKEKDRALKVGMTDFLTKPFTPIQLLNLLRQYSEEDQRKPATIVEEVSDEFVFNSALDTAYLEEFYEDDLEHATDMFETFLEYSLEEFKQLPDLLQEQTREDFRKLAHKLKPSFSMVGLTHLTNTMERLEYLTAEGESMDILANTLEKVSEEINNIKPLLTEELNRMRVRLN